mmetsp:Transcript_137526/g.343120  ORF Transcript_137526/g.343120 Transcript_137526/m.343120 type:complete len:203 (-) Transcript_137526:1002-1610(-)
MDHGANFCAAHALIARQPKRILQLRILLKHLHAVLLCLETQRETQERHNPLGVPQVLRDRCLVDLGTQHGLGAQDRPDDAGAVEVGVHNDAQEHVVPGDVDLLLRRLAGHVGAVGPQGLGAVVGVEGDEEAVLRADLDGLLLSPRHGAGGLQDGVARGLEHPLEVLVALVSAKALREGPTKDGDHPDVLQQLPACLRARVAP